MIDAIAFVVVLAAVLTAVMVLATRRRHGRLQVAAAGCLMALGSVSLFVAAFLIALNASLAVHPAARPESPVVIHGQDLTSPYTFTAAPTSIPESPIGDARDTVPPDPGTGPYPTCWVKGPIPGQPCPPKPPGWRPPH